MASRLVLLTICNAELGKSHQKNATGNKVHYALPFLNDRKCPMSWQPVVERHGCCCTSHQTTATLCAALEALLGLRVGRFD